MSAKTKIVLEIHYDVSEEDRNDWIADSLVANDGVGYLDEDYMLAMRIDDAKKFDSFADAAAQIESLEDSPSDWPIIEFRLICVQDDSSED